MSEAAAFELREEYRPVVDDDGNETNEHAWHGGVIAYGHDSQSFDVAKALAAEADGIIVTGDVALGNRLRTYLPLREVDVPEGREPVDPDSRRAALTKLSKAAVVDEAETLGVVYPPNATKQMIVDAIILATGEAEANEPTPDDGAGDGAEA